MFVRKVGSRVSGFAPFGTFQFSFSSDELVLKAALLPGLGGLLSSSDIRELRERDFLSSWLGDMESEGSELSEIVWLRFKCLDD